jgi:dolichol-phosphate mannosyltransferase
VYASSGSGLVVVVPTYNEAENVPLLVSRVEAVRETHPFDVLFVDDNSPDGTGGIVAELTIQHGWLHMIERERPMGLGSAYRDGFRWALDHGYERVGEMDADLSHDPAVIPDLDRAVVSGADLALGSRYVPGGGSEGWPISRRALSKGANLFARTILRLQTHDVTGGFRVFSARAIDLLVESGTECDGYGFQIEGVVALTRAGLPVVEVPITFRDRQHGRSKMSKKIMWEAGLRCVRMAGRYEPATPGREHPLTLASSTEEGAR